MDEGVYTPRDDQIITKSQKTRLTWKEKGCSAVAPIARFDEDGNLIFIWHWYDLHIEHLKVYMDTPYAQIAEYEPNTEHEEKHVEYYGRVHGTSKEEWMSLEKSIHKRIRAECANVAKTHSIQ